MFHLNVWVHKSGNSDLWRQWTEQNKLGISDIPECTTTQWPITRKQFNSTSGLLYAKMSPPLFDFIEAKDKLTVGKRQIVFIYGKVHHSVLCCIIPNYAFPKACDPPRFIFHYFFANLASANSLVLSHVKCYCRKLVGIDQASAGWQKQ